MQKYPWGDRKDGAKEERNTHASYVKFESNSESESEPASQRERERIRISSN